MKKIINKILPNSFKELIRSIMKKYIDGGGYWLKSYSQEGEDIILARIFGEQQTGFYIDVGAHHPYRFSNTYFFYKRGWKGINIDAMPGSMKIFNKYRPRDKNIEAGISDTKKKMKYHIFNEPAINTFSEEIAKKANSPEYRIIDVIELDTLTLEEILDINLEAGQKIDFLDIDVEGFDFNVIKSNNWQKYRPKVILVEILKITNIFDLKDNEIVKYLEETGYQFFAKTYNTIIFIETEYINFTQI